MRTCLGILGACTSGLSAQVQKRFLPLCVGYVHPALDLFAPLHGGDRGVLATADIVEGDQVLMAACMRP